MLLAKIENPILKDSLKSLDPNKAPGAFSTAISGIISLFFLAAVIVFVLYFLLAGIGWIMSEGDEAKVKASREKIVSALMGFLVTFSVLAILRLIGFVFGIDMLEQLQLPLIPLI